MKMNIRQKALMGGLVAGLMGLSSVGAADGNLTSRTEIFVEDFTATTHKNSESRVSGWGDGFIALPPAGGNYYDGDYLSMPQTPLPAPATRPPVTMVTQMVAGNFLQHKDSSTQADDAIALSPTRDCHFHFLKNLGTGRDPIEHMGWDVGTESTFNSYMINDSQEDWCKADSTDDTSGDLRSGVQLIGGDFNGDGYKDLLYLEAAKRNSDGKLTSAWAFINRASPRTVGGVSIPRFARYNLISDSAIRNSLIYLHWSGDQALAVDWNGDGRDEVVLATSRPSGVRIVKLTFAANGQSVTTWQNLIDDVPIKTTSVASSSSEATQGNECDDKIERGRGITAVTVGKFNNDEHWDIVAGSLSEENLYYWPSDADGNYDTQNPETITFPQGGAVILQTADWDLDGDDDFIVGRSTYGCNGSEVIADGKSYGGAVWMYSNSPDEFNPDDESKRFNQALNPIAELGGDIDYATTIKLDNDAEGRTDFILGDGASWGNFYYYFFNSWLGVYKREGIALSKDISEGYVNSDVDLIVNIRLNSVTVTGFNDETEVVISVSNDGGETWGELQSNELPATLNGSGPDFHNFTAYGSELVWKAELKGSEGKMVGEKEISLLNEPEFINAGLSKQTPKITQIVWEYTVVQGKKTYSRSGLAQKNWKVGDVDHTVIYSAAFDYPGFRGYLRSFDITDMDEKASSVINPGDNPHLDPDKDWEAGELSRGTGAGTARAIYTAIDNDGNGTFEQRLTLTTDAVRTSSVQDLMDVTASEGPDVLSFFRSGLGDVDHWKLYDVGHSAPVYVGPAQYQLAVGEMAEDEYAAYADNNYANFRAAKANRSESIYIGTNGGGLHSFNVSTGRERWMWVTPNQLNKLKKQRRVEENTNGAETITYDHQYFIDNGVFVQDIYDGSTWKTVMVVGQGQGSGKSDGETSQANYYSALDITDPDNPKPLWQFGDIVESSRDECSGTGSIELVEQQCEENRSCDNSCCSEGHIFAPNDNGEIVIEGHNYLPPIVSYQNGVSWQANSCNDSTPYALAVKDDGANYDGCPNSPQVTAEGEMIRCGSKVSYMFEIGDADKYSFYFKLEGTPGSQIWVSLNDYFIINTPIGITGEVWVRGPFYLWTGPGPYTLDIWMKTPGVKVHKVVISPDNSFDTTTNPAAECVEQCEPRECTMVTNTINVAPGAASPECGALDPGRQCCTYADTAGGLDGGTFCREIGEACADAPPDSAMGETWSKPAFARVRVGGTPKWVVFFASGYNNLNDTINVGRSLYAIDAGTGEKLGQWDFDDPEDRDEANYPNIDNTLPGSPAVADIDDDGLVDRVYIGDLEGRLWKVDTQADLNNAPSCVLFDAGKKSSGAPRRWAPIVTRPAIAVFNENEPNVYFGTGADDRAPNTLVYQFFGVQDSLTTGAGCPAAKYEDDLKGKDYEWVIGDDEVLPCSDADNPNCWGPRYWADPVIVDNSRIFMASLSGHIEDIDPRSNIAGESRVYGRALRRHRTTAGHWVNAGETIFREENTAAPKEYYTLTTKLRQSPMIIGSSFSPWSRRTAKFKSTESSRVMMQGYSDTDVGTPDSAPEGAPPIVDPGTALSNLMRVLRWREVPLGAGCSGGEG